MNLQISFLAASATPGRVFGLDAQTLIQIGIQLFNSGLLAAVLSFILYKPVRNFLQNRADKIKEQLERSENDMAKANELKFQYEKKLKDIEAEREEILNSARKLAVEKSNLILSETKSEANALKEQVAIDVKKERARAKGEIKQTVIEVASAMTEKFLVSAMNKDVQDKLFAETLAELEEMTWPN